MSKADEFLAIYNQHRVLIEKSKVQTLSRAEHGELMSAVAKLEVLAKFLRFRLKSIDPEIADAVKAAKVFNDHYRRKDELDQTLLGENA